MELTAIEFTNDTRFNITAFNADTLESTDYGVIMPDGTVIECTFGLHSQAYAIGAMLYVLKHCPEKYYDKEINLTELVDEESVDSVLVDPYELSLTSYGLAKQLDYYKENEPELYETLAKASFINAKVYTSDHQDFLIEHAQAWLNENAKYIWGIRVVYLMKTDFDFWVDNEYPEWLNLMYHHFGIEFDKEDAEASDYNNYDHRFELPDEIVEFFNDYDQKRVKNVLHLYPTYREILGVPPHYGSLWHYNFTDVDLDDDIFRNFSPSI